MTSRPPGARAQFGLECGEFTDLPVQDALDEETGPGDVLDAVRAGTFVRPDCLESVVSSDTPFVIGDGSGPEDLEGRGLRITIAARADDESEEPGAAEGTFTFLHSNASGGIVTMLKGTIDCLRTTSTVAYATGVIRTDKKTTTSFPPDVGGINPIAGEGINPNGQPIAPTIIDRGTSDLVLWNLPFLTGVRIVAPCQPGFVAHVVDEGDYLVNH